MRRIWNGIGLRSGGRWIATGEDCEEPRMAVHKVRDWPAYAIRGVGPPTRPNPHATQCRGCTAAGVATQGPITKTPPSRDGASRPLLWSMLATERLDTRVSDYYGYRKLFGRCSLTTGCSRGQARPEIESHLRCGGGNTLRRRDAVDHARYLQQASQVHFSVGQWMDLSLTSITRRSPFRPTSVPIAAERSCIRS